jgi:molecular chaperone GrpE
MRQFQTVQAREQEAAARASLPLLETLTGLHEALVRGEKAFRAAERQLPQSLAEELRQSLQREFQNAPAWRRWLSGSWLSEAQRQCGEQVAQTGASELGKLLEGYTLIVRRLERDLEAHGVRRIETLGRRVDPQLMTVVELVDDPQLPPETVVEELRPGYLRGDRLIRFAEVRAVAARRSRPDADDFAGQSREQQAGESSQAEQDSFARGYSDH